MAWAFLERHHNNFYLVQMTTNGMFQAAAQKEKMKG